MNVRLNYPFSFTAGIVYQGALRMNTYSARVWMTTATEESQDHNVAYERMRYLVENIIDSSIFVEHTDIDRCRALAAAGVNVITLPAEPVDQIIGLMLYCKLNAVMQDRIIIHDIEISSSLGEGMVYLHNDEENIGPFADDGWWNEPDTSCCHQSLLRVDNVMMMPASPNWRDLALVWKDDADQPEETGNTIVFADFNRNEAK